MGKLKASLFAIGITGNSIFDLTNMHNRDSTFEPYVRLRESFQLCNIDLNTDDINNSEQIIFQLHQDVQNTDSKAPAYLLLNETSMVRPVNADRMSLCKYRKIFTWDDELADGNRFVKINFPNPIQVHAVDGFSKRDRFCCLIAGNKTLSVRDNRNLYPERVTTIRWFEANAPKDFDLYGIGWDMPAVDSGLIGKIERRFWRLLANVFQLRPFPSYRGQITHKREVLTRTRFAICYENVRDLPGYITEKIFDSFFSGCIPVYWGASNIEDYVPSDCFIDRRKFTNTEEVYHFLIAMTENEFIGYQQRIVRFLQSAAAYSFSSDFFAETIVKTIVQDLGI